MERWQRVTLAALAILLAAGLILVRLLLDLNDLRRQATTQELIEILARQIGLYHSARGHLPESLDDLALELPEELSGFDGEPADAWGHPLLYYRAGEGGRGDYVIASPGRDGAFDAPPGAYLERRTYSSTRGYPDADIVLVRGRILQGAVEPATRQESDDPGAP
jgi:hypothetical protein